MPLPWGKGKTGWYTMKSNFIIKICSSSLSIYFYAFQLAPQLKELLVIFCSIFHSYLLAQRPFSRSLSREFFFQGIGQLKYLWFSSFHFLRAKKFHSCFVFLQHFVHVSNNKPYYIITHCILIPSGGEFCATTTFPNITHPLNSNSIIP